MKKLLCLLLSLMLMLTALTALAGDQSTKKLNIVTTIFPQYDFVRAIAGDKVELNMLLKPGTDSHAFEPTPKDIKDLQNAELFIYVGGPDDTPFETMLESLGDKAPATLKLVDCVSVLSEEMVEGMQATAHEHEHEHDEIKLEDIKDRELDDFDGEYQSIEPLYADGSLDSFIKEIAQENEMSFEEMKAFALANFKSEYSHMAIEENTLKVTSNKGEISAEYNYTGFVPIYSEDKEILGAWYGYEIKNAVEGMPTYLAFNDHGLGGEDHHDEDEHEEHEHIAHFHIRYGNQSVQALVDTEGWSPMFFDAKATKEELIEAVVGHSHNHEHEEEIDEHVWTSIENAENIVIALSKILQEKDPANAEFYRANTATYLEELDKLDNEFENLVDGAKRHTLVFGDRFPFRYFVEEYGLDYYAAFVGCSNETEASAGTVAFLVNKVKEESLPVVAKIELSNGQIADAIAQASGTKVITLHSCHNLSKEDFEAGKTYISLMRENLEALKEALN